MNAREYTFLAADALMLRVDENGRSLACIR
jgi:hypothetical protein